MQFYWASSDPVCIGASHVRINSYNKEMNLFGHISVNIWIFSKSSFTSRTLLLWISKSAVVAYISTEKLAFFAWYINFSFFSINLTVLKISISSCLYAKCCYWLRCTIVIQIKIPFEKREGNVSEPSLVLHTVTSCLVAMFLFICQFVERSRILSLIWICNYQINKYPKLQGRNWHFLKIR